MFSNEDARKRVLVEIRFADGRVVTGNLLLPMAGELQRTMNNDIRFLEFEDYDGSVRLLAKSSVTEIASRSLAKAPSLKADFSGAEQDPYGALGISRTASWHEVRQAYVRQSKLYHPDQYTSIGLPDEVLRYLSTMFARTNTAYHLLERAQKAQAQGEATRGAEAQQASGRG